MAQISVEVNGRPYAVGCEDGQEAHLIELAKMFDHQVRQVGQDMGQLGDTRLFLMGALLLADELADARGRLAALQTEAARLQSDRSRVETRAVLALDNAAKRIEKLASEEA
ncbi:cell division protein ZapA [Phenylobacterium sp.]|jgi:cell division protein ZapA|uniref:cell division protein ZapA n=1 Tax=Phenylobacterium sp. TaxID=1871053 RepID=UPI002E3370E0|nr:cell division protein ZapA [Phenylobacterium sp.]HEX3365195.1 cell division protein ZapA [Phenylobacterium sp.]